jgi:hypothetical protein
MATQGTVVDTTLAKEFQTLLNAPDGTTQFASLGDGAVATDELI